MVPDPIPGSASPSAPFGSELPPQPLSLPVPELPSQQVDSEIYEAWKKHMILGYQQNTRMFNQLLDAFMRPYWTTVWMYRLMFGVGVVGFILAAVLSVQYGITFGMLFGGLTVVAFLAFFVRHPLQALEQNLLIITWLGMIYNTYWTRLMYANDTKQIQQDLDEITQTAIRQINRLLEKQVEVSGKRATPSAGEPPTGTSTDG
jgi:hypothetical protein